MLHRWFALFSLLITLFFPAVVRAVARQDVSLNGAWESVKVASLDNAPPGQGWQPIEVPGQLSGTNYERAWFRRSFNLPENWRGGRILLHFGGVKWNSRVLVNGRNVGGHFNGFDAFELDATDAVKFGAANELRVGVHDWTATFAPGTPRLDFSKATGLGPRNVPKKQVIAPFGGHMGTYGIWDDVTLRLVSPLHVQSTFIRPSLKEKRLNVEVQLSGAAPDTIEPVQARVFEAGSGRNDKGQWNIKGTELFSLPTASLKSVNQIHFALREPALQMWSPQSPKLYVLEIQVGEDVYRERFGWRELSRQGPDFFFNGQKTHLLASSWWPAANQPVSRDEARRQLLALKKANTFTFRTHTQPWPRRWYEVADEVGMMMIPEGALWCDSDAYKIEDDRFWQHYGDHLRNMARNLRNHASVVMYSLENEMRHCMGRDDPLLESGFIRMAKLVREVDSTHLLTFEADGDPGSTPTSGGIADVIGMHYPNEYPERRNWPNDAYWMEAPRPLSLFWKGGQPFLWDRKKPLYIGEFLWVSANSTPAAHTVFFGDEAYRDHQAYSARAKALAWRMQIQAYRHYGVSGLSPWTTNENGPLNERNPTWLAHRDMYRPLAVFPREYDSRFWSGESVTRTLQIFNDTRQFQPKVLLRWAVQDGGKTLSSGTRTLNLLSGAHQETKINLAMPAVTTTRNLQMVLTLQGAGGRQFRERWPIRVFPRPFNAPASNSTSLTSGVKPTSAPSEVLSRGTCDVFAPTARAGTQTLRDVLQNMGYKVRPLNRLEDWDGKNLLVVGPRELVGINGSGTATPVQVIGATGSLRQFLAQRVAGGGRVLVLEPREDEWLPVSLSSQSSTMTFAQYRSHPILRGVNPGDLRWWRGDNLVSRQEVPRVAGAGKALVVSGSGEGISHTPLLEMPQGRGVWLVCGLRVLEKFQAEPMARLLLERMLDYAQKYRAPGGTTRLLVSDDLNSRLSTLGVAGHRLTDWNALKYPEVTLLILQADSATVLRNTEQLKSFVQSGGKVLWHRPQSDGFDAVMRALNLEVERQAYRGPALRAENIPGDFQTLAREDFYWPGTSTAVSWSAAPLSPEIAEAVFAEPAQPIQGQTYEAEARPQLEGQLVRVEGGEVGFFTAGSATYQLTLAESGRYVLSLTARGTSMNNVFPQIAVQLDDERLATLSLSQRESRLYNLTFNARAGRHKLTLQFLNDESGNGEDRNLWIDKWVLGRPTGNSPFQSLTVPAALARYPSGRGEWVFSALRWDEASAHTAKANRLISGLLSALDVAWKAPPPSSVVEVEKFEPQAELTWFRKESNGVYMGSAGHIEGPVRVARAGYYRVRVWGKGTPGKNVYPIVVLSSPQNGQDKELGRVEIKSNDWAAHEMEVLLPPGESTLRLRFINDDAPAPEDRNLWLDRLEFEAFADGALRR
jgi:hypothetical protein